MNMFKRPWLRHCSHVAAAIAVLSSSAHAAFDEANGVPTRERGFQAGKVSFGPTDFDSINLLNGNLTMTIPLGPTVPVNGSLSYSLQLTYNSNAWDAEEYRCAHTEGGQTTTKEFTSLVPNRTSNAGFGWSVNLGGYFPAQADQTEAFFRSKDTYVGPDGAQHRFYSVPGESYKLTRDGSYLKETTFPSCGHTGGNDPSLFAGSDCKMITFPGGEKHFFRNMGSEQQPLYRLIEMRDTHGNGVDVRYYARSWELRPAFGSSYPRTHIDFDFPEYSYQRVTQVRTVHPQGSGDGLYEFNYAMNQSIERHRYGLPGYPGGNGLNCGDSPGVPLPPATVLDEYVNVDLLSSITLPNDQTVNFQYDSSDNDGQKSGAISQYRQPTGAKVQFDYGPIVNAFRGIVIDDPAVDGSQHFLGTNYGVTEKRLYEGDPSAGNLRRTWRYRHRFIRSTPFRDITTLITQTKDIAQGTTRTSWNYFNGIQNPGGVDDDDSWQGQPLTFEAAQDSEGGYLSSIYFGRGAAPDLQGSSAAVVLNPPSSEILRKTYIKVEADSRRAVAGQDQNIRQSYSTTYYLDDQVNGVARFKRTRKSDYRSFGRYRVVRESSNFAGDANQHYVETVTNYLPVGVVSNKWLLGLYDSVEVTDRSGALTTSKRTEYEYNSDTGFLDRLVIRSGITQDQDLVREFSPDNNGNVRTITFKLGDDAQYRIEQQHKYGTVEKAFFTTCASTNVPFLHTINESFGSTWAPGASWDESGVRTDLAYDNMWRLLNTYPQGAPGTRIVYNDGLKFVQVLSCPEIKEGDIWTHTPSEIGCNDGSALKKTWYNYDYLGRVEWERHTTVEDVNTTQGDSNLLGKQTVYDHRGRIDWKDVDFRVINASQGHSSTRVNFANYDAFDRPRLVTYPDDRRVESAFTGDRLREITKGMGAEAVIVKQVFDGKGRLVKVTEHSASTVEGPAPVSTTYKYDVHGNIVEVCIGPTGSGCAQRRTFDYDGRGLLVREEHPEIVGPQTYTYDALGKVTSKNGPSHPDHLKFEYDAAGRLTRVWANVDTDNNSATDPTLEVMKEWVYGKENVLKPDQSVADFRKGKLVLAKRHNWVPNLRAAGAPMERITITQRLSYDFGGEPVEVDGKLIDYGRSGRLGSVQWTSSAGDQFAYTYTDVDLLGNTTGMSYPFPHRPDASNSSDSVRSVFEEGQLRSVQFDGRPVIDHIRYGLNGSPDRVEHANGVVDQALQNLGGPWTPLHGVKVTDASSTLLDLSPMSYDSRGNITAIGESEFRYDPVNRLTWASIATQSAGDREFAASYDLAGNLRSLDHDGVEIDLQPELASNRMSGQGVQYDDAGNITRFVINNVAVDLRYDGFNRVTAMTGPVSQKTFLYDINDERIAVIDHASVTPQQTWTLRDTGHRVLSQWIKRGELALDGTPDGQSQRPQWSRSREYVYANGSAVAVVHHAIDGALGEIEHLHRDHLGSVRMVTDASGQVLERRDYYPFGRLIGAPVEGTEPLQFTGHERDALPDDPSGHSDLDYMHARNYQNSLGRFLSVDPVLGTARRPQSWNRYVYVGNNPMSHVDPDGRETVFKVGPISFDSSTIGASFKFGSVQFEASMKSHGDPRGRPGSRFTSRTTTKLSASVVVGGELEYTVVQKRRVVRQSHVRAPASVPSGSKQESLKLRVSGKAPVVTGSVDVVDIYSNLRDGAAVEDVFGSFEAKTSAEAEAMFMGLKVDLSLGESGLESAANFVADWWVNGWGGSEDDCSGSSCMPVRDVPQTHDQTTNR